jgi:hypothetical protein
MKKIFNILILTSLLNVGAFSQRIYFCANYTSSGDPISAGTVWTITASGGYVYFLFQKNASSDMPKTVNFYINKLSGTDYVSFDVKAVTPESNQSFAILDYKFLTAGSYQVVAKDENLRELTKEYVTINNKEETTTTTTTTSSQEPDYYSSSSITSGTSIDDYGIVSGTSETYTIPAQGAYVIFKVDNLGKALNTEQLIVDVYKKNEAGTYEFHETKNYDIKSTLDWVYFKYTFYAAGDYKLSVYNKDWKYIYTAYATIKSL